MFPSSRYFAAATMTYFDYTSTADVDHAMAAAILVRHSAIEKVGLMDEKLTIYYNDLDWSLRFKQAGWRTVFLPEAKVVHVGGATMKSMMADYGFVKEQYENAFHYFRKHFGSASVVVYRTLLFLGFLPRALLWVFARTLKPTRETRLRFAFSLHTLRVALKA